MTAKDDAGKAMGPVEKLRWLGDAAALTEPRPDKLSRAELAALNVIANTMNSKTGIAWLSMATIGRRTGTTIRTANRTIRRLLELGLIELVKRGTWQGKANHYTLNRHYFSQSAGSDAGDTTPVEVVTPSVEGSDAQGTKVVTPTSDISIPESEPLAKDEGDRSQAEAGTAPLRPVGACVASRQTKRGADQFPEFWQVWPKRTAVAATEQAIAEALAEGVSLSEIIAGTERFARYCEATGTPPRWKPYTFVSGDKWRDDWELTRRAPASKPAKASVWVELPEWRKWDRSSDAAFACDESKFDDWCEANPAPPRWKNTATGATAADRAWDSDTTDRTPPPDDWDGVTRIDMWERRHAPTSKPAKATTTAKAAKDTGKAKPQREPRRKHVWIENRAAWNAYRRGLDDAQDRAIRAGGGVDAIRPRMQEYVAEYKAANPIPPRWRHSETGQLWGALNDPRPADDWTPPPT